MSKKKTSAPVHENRGIILSEKASFNARNVVVGDDGSIVDKSISNEQRDDVLQLITSIEKLVCELPKELSEDRKTIEAFADVLKQEAQKPSPNKTLWSVTGNGLIEASKAVVSITPNLLQTAKRIVEFFI